MKILLHNDRLVMEVKMSSGYQSQNITTFKAFNTHMHAQIQSSNMIRTPDPLNLSTGLMDGYTLSLCPCCLTAGLTNQACG